METCQRIFIHKNEKFGGRMFNVIGWIKCDAHNLFVKNVFTITRWAAIAAIAYICEDERQVNKKCVSNHQKLQKKLSNPHNHQEGEGLNLKKLWHFWFLA